jgi:iron(III) transport system ATP-binding protein
VTHDQDEALSMSDQILVMDGGRILRDATPEQTYLQPRGRFVGHCNFPTGAVTAGPDDSSSRRYMA